jgi:hypothetical protein
MSDTYVCQFDWCTSDHTDKHDDFDGLGGRFHWGDAVAFALPDEPDWTWTRDPDSVAYKLVCWSPAEGPDEIRMAFDEGLGAALTPDEVRAYAAWLVERAAELEAMQEALR